MKFCPECGTRLPEGARFCAGCGRAVEALRGDVPAATDRPAAPPRQPLAAAPRGWREQLPGLAVLTAFLAVGLGLWVTILQPGPQTSSAPSRSAPPAESASGVPAGHPPTTLPEEAKKFVSSMVAKAEAAPNDVAAWKSLAQVQARAAEIDPSYSAAAIASFNHVLGIAPDDEEAIRGLGNVYYDQQQFASAAEQYERYLTKHPDDPSVQTDLATTYLYQRQFDRAVDLYRTVLKAHPDFLQAHFNLGLAHEALGRHDEALASLATARGLATDDATKNQIDRVTAQLKGEPAAGPRLGPAPGGGGMASGRGGAATGAGPAPAAPGGAPGSVAAPATDFRSAVENGLRAHPILGPKITAIEWPEPTRARVTVASFPMQAMPEFARNLFKARLETILDDAKTRFGTTEETSIELVDAANGASMERVTH